MTESDDAVPPPEPSVESLRALQQDATRRKRRTMVILFVVIPVVCAAGAIGWSQWSDREAARVVGEAWSKVSACLVGAPLGPNERASLRMRAMQFSAVHAERELKADARWPSRCADYVAQLYEVMRQNGLDKDGEQGLGPRAEAFAPVLRKAEAMTDLSAQVDGLFTAAAGRKLVATAQSLPTASPEPTVSLTLDSLPESARVSELQYTLDRVTATDTMVDTGLHLLVNDQHVSPTPILCSFVQSGDDRCRPLGGELTGKAGLSLGGTTDDGASPLVFVGPAGEGGIYRADSAKLVASLNAAAAYSARSGYVAIASMPTENKGSFELVQQASDGAEVRRQKIEPDSFDIKVTAIHRTEILWDKLLVQVLNEEDESSKPRLLYLQLPSQDKKPHFVEIAPVNWVNAPILGCKTDKSMVVRIGLDEGFITFFGEGRWSTPVRVDNFPPAFGCDQGEAVFTDGSGGQQRCTPAGCRFTEGASPQYEPFPQREGALADLNGKILSIALTDKRGGVRYRYADGLNLNAVGQDRLLFDDLVAKGALQQDSTALSMRLAGRGRFAIALLTTPAGVFAIRFDADGKPVPAKIAR